MDADRLTFAPKTGLADYITRLRLTDLFLVTFPYNAGTIVSDALRMGLPVVTLTGKPLRHAWPASGICRSAEPFDCQTNGATATGFWSVAGMAAGSRTAPWVLRDTAQTFKASAQP